MKLTRTTGAVMFVALAIGGLGLWRLAWDEGPKQPLSAPDAQAISECLPKVDLATGAAISIAPSSGNPTKFVVVATSAGSLPRAAAATASSAASSVRSVVYLKKGDTPFEIKLDAGAVQVVLRDAALKIGAPARFAPATDSSTVEVDDTDFLGSHPPGTPKEATVAVTAGDKLGAFALATPLSVAPVQPLQAEIWLESLPPLLVAERASGQSGLGAVSVDAATPGLHLTSTPAPNLVACAAVDTPKWDRVGAAILPTQGSQGASVRLTLPTDLLPTGFGPPTRLRVVLSSTDGQSAAFGGLVLVGRLPAALVALAVTGVLIGMCMYHRAMAIGKGKNGQSRWISGLFMGSDGTPSLSLLQIFIWTTITVWGFCYVYVVAGRLLSMTPEMMELLGIAGAGTVVARWVAVGNLAPGASADDADAQDEFWQMLSTNGTFDLLKLQLLLFTIVIGMYVVWRIADAGAFPNLDPNTLLLLGVSQGIYVTGKLTSTSDLSKAQTAKVNVDVSAQTLANDQAALAALQVRQSGLTTDLSNAKAAGAPTAPIQQQLDAVTADVAKATNAVAASQSALDTARTAYNQSLDALKLK